ncbi:hypothetical protein DENSPDRAFT_886877 [Dentipellis sp. KUC8613]|nr:hypothetical protein DENSPDRAFT_886877 [Dentipellis sp. KUC8613]
MLHFSLCAHPSSLVPVPPLGPFLARSPPRSPSPTRVAGPSSRSRFLCARAPCVHISSCTPPNTPSHLVPSRRRRAVLALSRALLVVVAGLLAPTRPSRLAPSHPCHAVVVLSRRCRAPVQPRLVWPRARLPYLCPPALFEPPSGPHTRLAPASRPRAPPSPLRRAPRSFVPLAPSRPRALLVPFAHSPRRCAVVVPSSCRRRSHVAPSCLRVHPSRHRAPVLAHSPRCHPVVTPSTYRCCPVVAPVSCIRALFTSLMPYSCCCCPFVMLVSPLHCAVLAPTGPSRVVTH